MGPFLATVRLGTEVTAGFKALHKLRNLPHWERNYIKIKSLWETFKDIL